MNLFKFTPSGAPTVLDEGASINGYSRITWVERYGTPGEFTLEAPLSSGLSVFLPIGSMISHVDTMEVMIVENHEIEEETKDDPTLTITGRSFVSYLENRLVGMIDARAQPDWHAYELTAAYTWVQIVKLINDHITSPPAAANDAISNVQANHSLSGTGESVARTVEHGELLDHVTKLLKIDDLGIRTIRRNPFGVTGGSATQTNINIYRGVDRSANIMFSWISGDIQKARYLFSQKNNKNCALVKGNHYQVIVDGSETNYDRRMMLVDVGDIDAKMIEASKTQAEILAFLTTRGQQALADQNFLSMTQFDLSNTGKAQFRKDYNIGDLISVDGNYGAIAVRRVSEYAEIEDENGNSGHPTLSEVGE